jgi:hypothetical protein
MAITGCPGFGLPKVTLPSNYTDSLWLEKSLLTTFLPDFGLDRDLFNFAFCFLIPSSWTGSPEKLECLSINTYKNL